MCPGSTQCDGTFVLFSPRILFANAKEIIANYMYYVVPVLSRRFFTLRMLFFSNVLLIWILLTLLQTVSHSFIECFLGKKVVVFLYLSHNPLCLPTRDGLLCAVCMLLCAVPSFAVLPGALMCVSYMGELTVWIVFPTVAIRMYRSSQLVPLDSCLTAAACLSSAC